MRGQCRGREPRRPAERGTQQQASPCPSLSPLLSLEVRAHRTLVTCHPFPHLLTAAHPSAHKHQGEDLASRSPPDPAARCWACRKHQQGSLGPGLCRAQRAAGSARQGCTMGQPETAPFSPETSGQELQVRGAEGAAAGEGQHLPRWVGGASARPCLGRRCPS